MSDADARGGSLLRVCLDDVCRPGFTGEPADEEEIEVDDGDAVPSLGAEPDRIRLTMGAACVLEAWVKVVHGLKNNRGTPLHTCPGAERCGILAALRQVDAEKRRLRPGARAPQERRA